MDLHLIQKQMKKLQQKQREDLIFQLIKEGSPFKQSMGHKVNVLKKIEQFQLQSKRAFLQQKKSILLSKDQPFTPSKPQKRVSFLDENEQKKRQETQNLKRKFFQEKIREQKGKNQLSRNIRSVQAKVQCLIDSLFSKSHLKFDKNLSTMSQSHQPSKDFQFIKNPSILQTEMKNSIFTPNLSTKYRHESSLKKEMSCQTIHIENEPSQIIIKYRYQNQPNPQQQYSPRQCLRNAKSSPKFNQSTVFTASETSLNPKYKDKVVNFNKFNETRSETNMKRTYSVSDISRSESKFESSTPTKNKSVVSLNHQNSNSDKLKWSRNLTQEKCRHSIDVEIFKNKIFYLFQQSTAKKRQ